MKALEINIVGTANVVKLCMSYGMKLIFIWTDYVFRGERGLYREEDPLHPVNKYAWSKLGGECAVRRYHNSVIMWRSLCRKSTSAQAPIDYGRD
jgi:dTDP-4-dehydrorhamnose reductase